MTTSNDDTIRIWDANNGDELLIPNARCDFAKFFPNGKSIVFHSKYGPNKGINIMHALDFKHNRENTKSIRRADIPTG